jgi:hypothetical protein
MVGEIISEWVGEIKSEYPGEIVGIRTLVYLCTSAIEAWPVILAIRPPCLVRAQCCAQYLHAAQSLKAEGTTGIINTADHS